MTWDGIAPDNFVSINKRDIVARGNEICRLCWRIIDVGTLVKAFPLFNERTLYYHRDGECPRGDNDDKTGVT